MAERGVEKDDKESGFTNRPRSLALLCSDPKNVTV